MVCADYDNHIAATDRYNLGAMIQAVSVEQYQLVALPETQNFAEMSGCSTCYRDFGSFAQGGRVENSGVHDSIISYADTGC
jgi:protein-arginine kinase activator protein McsA